MDLRSILPGIVSHWSFDLPVWIGVALVVLLYVRGSIYSRKRGIGARTLRPWRGVVLACSLLLLIVALQSPVDYWSDDLIWVHMVQHELLAVVVAPLAVLSEPWWPMWRGVPLGVRRGVLRWAMRNRWPRRIGGGVMRFLGNPVAAWTLFVGNFYMWHLPQVYDFALEHELVHNSEHLLMLGTATLFWMQVLPSTTFHLRLGPFKRILYFYSTRLAFMPLTAAFAFSQTPLYPFYAHEARPAGMISAIVDQAAASGVMDLTETFIFFSITIVLIGLWLRADESAPEPESSRRRPLPVARPRSRASRRLARVQ
jgi:cytochrome c oxidase assembly factor CtaG